MHIKTLTFLSLSLIGISNLKSQDQPLESFALADVSLWESPFYAAQQTDKEYILELDVDRLLAPFLLDAGLEPKAERYGNWENTGLDGHIGGHYLSALALMYASTADDLLRDRLDYMLRELARCQEKNGNGYMGGIPGGQGMWNEISSGTIDAGSFSLNGKWVPLYNIHKLYAGLRDAYWYADSQLAKELLVGLTDWMVRITDGLTDEQLQEMLRSEHGGLNEVFADVYAITGEQQYLKLAERFSHHTILDPLLEKEDRLTGLHANTQIPKVIGFERVAALSANENWSDAAEFFWTTVVENRTIAIGGNSVREHFNPIDDFSGMIESNQGPETCNTYNMLRLSMMLFLSSADTRYLDYYERALYNHILSSQHPEGGFVYFTPIRPRHYRVYSQPHQGFWCCVGSGLENHGKYGELIYAHDSENIHVNLFIPSSVRWDEKQVTLTQQTRFPCEESSTLKLSLEKPAKFKLHIRRPKWLSGDMKLTVNGKAQQAALSTASYAVLERKWRDGDEVSIQLPMKTILEPLPGGSSWAAFVHGPIVLAAVTDSTDLAGLYADGKRMAHVAQGSFYPIDEAPMLVAEDPAAILPKLEPIEGEPLAFSVSGGVYPEKYTGLKLVPFFEVHDARYMLYWPVVTPGELEEKLAETREREAKLLELEKRTVDRVATGEQQPESDHNFQGERTNSGINDDHFWRDAQGWFSYDLRDERSEGSILRITYFGKDRDRDFDILINDKLLTSVSPDGTRGDTFFEMDYPIPDELKKGQTSGVMTVRFVAHENSTAGGVYYIRLLKD